MRLLIHGCGEAIRSLHHIHVLSEEAARRAKHSLVLPPLQFRYQAGAAAALVLALLGDLLMSWLSVRTRLTNFVALRAQGATSRQVASVLAWEQAIVYATALFLGIILGGILSITVVPSLIFTSIPRSGVQPEQQRI